jgi:aspartate/tyrosine/aromatic aminotransferase
MEGLKEFNNAAAKLILGGDSNILSEGRYLAFQTLSGTGAVRLGAEFLQRYV